MAERRTVTLIFLSLFTLLLTLYFNWSLFQEGIPSINSLALSDLVACIILILLYLLFYKTNKVTSLIFLMLFLSALSNVYFIVEGMTNPQYIAGCPMGPCLPIGYSITLLGSIELLPFILLFIAFLLRKRAIAGIGYVNIFLVGMVTSSFVAPIATGSFSFAYCALPSFTLNFAYLIFAGAVLISVSCAMFYMSANRIRGLLFFGLGILIGSLVLFDIARWIIIQCV